MPLPEPRIAGTEDAKAEPTPHMVSPASLPTETLSAPEPQAVAPPAPASFGPVSRTLAQRPPEPSLAPAPARPLTPAPASALPASLATPAAAPVPIPATRRLDAAALSRSLASSADRNPRTALNSAAIGSVIGQAVPRGVEGLTIRQRANLIDMIRSQITPCWNPPVPEQRSGDVTVVLRIRLDRAGAVAGSPRVSRINGRTKTNEAYANALAGSVRRAVLRCSPLKLPPELYDAWANVELNFDPKDIL